MQTSEDTREALALLPLPSLDHLSEQQVRGITCVFSGATLTTATAVTLGVRHATRAGEPVSWYPRASRHAMHGAAYTALIKHVFTGCKPCDDDKTLNECATGVALRRLMREYRR